MSWIAVHGRTKEQRKQPVNLEAVKLIRENVGIPVIANGDIKSVDNAKMVQEFTGVQGRAMLAFRLLLTDTLLYRMSKIFSSSPGNGQGSKNIIKIIFFVTVLSFYYFFNLNKNDVTNFVARLCLVQTYEQCHVKKQTR